MGHHIVKQPNGKYAIFSSMVDDFIGYDATREEIFESFRQDAIVEADRHTTNGLARADSPGSDRFEVDIETVRNIHGDAKADEWRDLLSLPQGERLRDAAGKASSHDVDGCDDPECKACN